MPKLPPEAGTIRGGGDVDRISVALRIADAELDPSAITKLLGVEPTFAARKGDVQDNVLGVVQRVGVWVFEFSGNPSEWTIGDAIEGLLAKLPATPTVWEQLRKHGKVDLFCAIYLHDLNRGVVLNSALLRTIADRGVDIGLDIYALGQSGND